MNDKKLTSQILNILSKTYPNVQCGLDFNNTFELLIATILSAQCTDKMVNKVTPNLFKHFPTPKTLSKANLSDIENIIRSTGFYKNKAKNIITTSQSLISNFNSNIPNAMEELITLSGVGRKTANVVLSNGFGINVGIVVDTHVTRISNLLELTASKNPIIIERDLMQLFPQKNWGLVSHLFITLGRSICIARRPQCKKCCLNKYCCSAQS